MRSWSVPNIIDGYREIVGKWIQMARASVTVDLKFSYFKLHMGEKLWECKLVMYKGKTYSSI